MDKIAPIEKVCEPHQHRMFWAGYKRLQADRTGVFSFLPTE